MSKSNVTVLSVIREIGYRYPKIYDGTYGIEIETETKGIENYPDGFFKSISDYPHAKYDIPIDKWEAHADGSLRNFGMEFVLKKPLKFDEAIDAIEDFKVKTKDISFIKNAPATSTHVHVNMLPETPTTLANFLALYTLFENILVEYSGESRRSNLFALPMRVAGKTAQNINDLIGLLLSRNPANANFTQGQIKYAAINLEPLFRFGSLELRSFRGETDLDEVKDWIRIIDKLLNYARNQELTPRIILFEYKMRGIEYLSTVFEEMADKIRAFVNDIGELIDKNLWFLYRIAILTDDWVALNKEVESKSKKKVSSNQIPEEALSQAAQWEPALHPTGNSTVILDDIEEEEYNDDLD